MNARSSCTDRCSLPRRRMRHRTCSASIFRTTKCDSGCSRGVDSLLLRQLSGSLPTFKMFAALATLRLANNLFEGAPLFRPCLANCSLTGTIPVVSGAGDVHEFPALLQLDVSNNKLTG